MAEQKERLRIVIVGGVAGGGSAAARARRVNASAEIVILEKGPAVSYANCGLPYHIGGEIENRSQLLIASADLFWDRFRVRVRTGHEVTSIDRKAEVLSGRTTDGGDFKLPYDRLILATGSAPIKPPFSESTAENVFYLWTLEDMDRVVTYMKKRPCKKATVVGAGYVGLEVLEQLKGREVKVTLVERLPQVLPNLDPELSKLVETELRRNGVAVELATEVENLLTSGHKATAVKLKGGGSVATDLVIVATGVRPRTELAEQAGLEMGEAGGVRINEYCQTSDPKIYACGDIVEYQHGVLGRPTRMPLAGPANRSGRIAGSHAAGGSTRPLGAVQGTAIVRVFSLAAGSTGLNERAARQAGIHYRTATIQAPHHAAYFPGARGLTVKILYAPEDGRLLGGAAVGAAGVDKRLDVLASLLHFGGSVHDLAELDLAYAPPFGAAKDPLHMAGFVAENDLAFHPLLARFDADLDGFQVVDVRTPAEIEKLPLAGAISIPLDELTERWTELDAQRPTVTVCHSGKRAHVAACWLKGHGFDSVANLNGGMSLRQWRSAPPADDD